MTWHSLIFTLYWNIHTLISWARFRHRQLRQAIAICLILPVNCVLIAWYMYACIPGTCLPHVWQSLSKQYKASDKQWSSKFQAVWHLLDNCLVIIAKWLSSTWQARTKHMPDGKLFDRVVGVRKGKESSGIRKKVSFFWLPPNYI